MYYRMDSLFPVPNLDVKRFVTEGKKVYVIKIEEGSMPPYVTSKGNVIKIRLHKAQGSCHK